MICRCLLLVGREGGFESLQNMIDRDHGVILPDSEGKLLTAKKIQFPSMYA